LISVRSKIPHRDGNDISGGFCEESVSHRCLIPKDRLKSIGLRPTAQRAYERANGREVRMDIATGNIEFIRRGFRETILFDEPGT